MLIYSSVFQRCFSLHSLSFVLPHSPEAPWILCLPSKFSIPVFLFVIVILILLPIFAHFEVLCRTVTWEGSCYGCQLLLSVILYLPPLKEKNIFVILKLFLIQGSLSFLVLGIFLPGTFYITQGISFTFFFEVRIHHLLPTLAFTPAGSGRSISSLYFCIWAESYLHELCFPICSPSWEDGSVLFSEKCWSHFPVIHVLNYLHVLW